MAQLEQTNLGWRTLAPDGSEVYLPEEIAREVYPDQFRVGTGEPERPDELPAVDAGQSLPVQPQPESQAPVQPALVDQGPVPDIALPAGIESARVSYSGYRPGPPEKEVRIDPGGLTQSYNAVGELYAGAEGLKQEGAKTGYQAQLGVDDAVADAAFDKDQILREHGTDTAVFNAQARKRRDDRIAQIEQTRAAIPQMDPKRWWKSRSAFQQGALMLSSAIDGLLAVSGRGSATATVDMAMKAVDQDMAAQETDIATARERAEGAVGDYNRLEDRIALEKLDLQELKGFKLDALAAELEAKAATFASEFTRAKYLREAGDIRKEATKLLQDATDKRFQYEVQLHGMNLDNRNKRADRAQRERHFRADLAYKRDKDATDRQAAGDAVKPDLIVGQSTGFKRKDGSAIRFPDTTAGREQRDKYNAAGLAANKVSKSLRRLRKMSFSRFQALKPNERAEIVAESMRATIAYGQISGERIGKGMSDEDFERFQKSLIGGDPNAALRLVDEKTFYKGMTESYDDLHESMNRLGRSTVDETDPQERENPIEWNHPPEEVDVTDKAGTSSFVEAGLTLSTVNPDDEATGEASFEAALGAANTVMTDLRSGRIDTPEAMRYAQDMARIADSPNTPPAIRKELRGMAAAIPTVEQNRTLKEVKKKQDEERIRNARPPGYLDIARDFISK